jgi:hypothetical protein
LRGGGVQLLQHRSSKDGFTASNKRTKMKTANSGIPRATTENVLEQTPPQIPIQYLSF